MFIHGMSKWLRSPIVLGAAFAVAVIGLSAGTGLAQSPSPKPTQKPLPTASPKEQGEEKPPPGAKKAPRKSEPGKPGADKKKEDAETPPVKVPSDVQEKLDRLMEKRGRKVAEPSSRPPTGPGKDRKRRMSRPKGKPAEEMGGGESDRLTPRRGPKRTPALDEGDETPAEVTTPINIPPSDVDVPPEERMYSFSIKDGTYQQLLEGVARQTGLGVLGGAPRDGKVSFVTEEVLTFDDMLRRVRMLLFKYKPHEPYWLLRRETHLEVIRVNDIYRILPRERMFRSIEGYREANLPDDELALVIYTPKAGSVADLKVIRDFMPDYVRVAPLEGRNAVTIFALVRDIEKYLQLIEIFVGGQRDSPRTTEIIRINHIPPTDAWAKVQTLMEVDGAGARPRTTSSKGRPRESSLLDTMREPEVSVVPDDAQGVLIVRAMQDKIEEIKLLLPLVDVDTRWPHEFVVIELQHTDAEEIVPMIEQILAASGGRAGSPILSSRTSRKKKRGKPTATATTTDDITLLPHPAGNAIIVIADENDVAQVRHLVSVFDKESQIGPIYIEVEHVDPDGAIDMLTQVLLGPGDSKRSIGQRFQLVPDPRGDAVWFKGTEKDLDKVREIIAAIDVPGGVVSLHIVRLEHQTPSFVAGILGQYESAGGVSASASVKGGKRGKRSSRPAGGPGAAGKFTADDEQKRLFVLCTDQEWEGYLQIIEQLEGEVEGEPAFVLIPVEHITPEEAIDRVTALMGGMGDGRKPGKDAVRYEPTDDAIVVTGATGDQIEQIQEILAIFDKPPAEIVQRTFEIRHVDPQTIIAAIKVLVVEPATGGGLAKPRGGKREPKVSPLGAISSPDVTIAPMGNRLVVRATREKMEQIATLIEEFDVEEGARTLRVYENFPPGADIAQIAETLRALLAGTAPSEKGKKRALARPGGPQIVPQPDLGKLIVIAEPEKFAEIEELLDILRSDRKIAEYETAFVEVAFADPTEVVELVEPLLNIKVRELVALGRLKGMPGPVEREGKTQKRGAQRTRSAGEWFHLEADVRNSRVVIAAPQVVIDEATKLIAEFDQPSETDELIVRTIELQNAAAAEMVKTVREMMGGQPARVGRGKGAGGGKTLERAAAAEFSIVEAPGGRAVVLRGTPESVEQATGWVEELDGISGGGRRIKVYEIQYADIRTLVNLIMATVDTPAKPTGGKKARPRGGRALQLEEDEDEWTTEIKRIGVEVYLEANLITNTMIVATTAPKLDEIDAIVAQFDTVEEGERWKPLLIPKFTYELQHNKDSYEAAFELEAVLEVLWEPSDELPRVDAAIWGDFLIVEYPHEDRFPEIEELIRKYVDKPGEDAGKIVRKAVVPPEGMTAEEVARWLQRKNPDIKFELRDISPRAGEDYGIERLRARRDQANPCVLPSAFRRMTDGLLSVALAQSDAGVDEPPPQKGQDDPDEDEDPVARAARSLLEEEESPSPQSETGDAETEELPGVDEPEEAGEVRVSYDDESRILIIEGDLECVDEVEDSLDDLKEEAKPTAPPDIRIYRVKYIDVFTATDIINEMFNATRQQRQAVMRQQQSAQRRLLQQQQRQQRQQRQPQQQQGKQAGEQGQPGRPQRGQQPAQSQMLQLPPTAVRVYPNPRDRSLILRADSSQYPALLELLATIDQPQPIESSFRTYPLEKLNAGEVEELLKGMLGLDETGGRRRRPTGGAAGRRGSAMTMTVEPSGHLPRPIMQEMITGTGVLGVDRKDIKISSNEEANTILVMAPEAALDYIGELIEQFESYELPERIWKSYELKYAQTDEVVEYLTNYFEEGRSPGQTRKGGKRGKAAPASTPWSLNAPTFVSYARLNLLSAQATAEQIEEIDKLIEQLDVQGDEGEWQTITLARADAQAVADTLTEMFGTTTGTRSRARGRGKQPTTAGTGPRFIGEEGGRIVFYSAPKSLYEDIHAAVENMEAQAQDPTPRVIQLVHAKASDVADAIESAYGSTRTTSRRGKQRGGTTSTARFSVTAHDPTKRLFVVADDETFAEIESLARNMDVKPTIGFEFQIYPLKYADAKKVHEQMSKLLTDYLRRLGRGADVEPFSVEVDEKANALIVLGSPAIFGFLEEQLPKIDTLANARDLPGSLIVTLKNANAQEVAQSINRLWGGRRLPTGETPPQAEANRSTNTLIVRGTQNQIDEIKKEFIDPLEELTPAKLMTETFTLKHAQPEAAAESINRIFEDLARAYRSIGRDSNVSPLEFTVIATPDVNTKQVVVQAGEQNMELVRARIAELDQADRAVASAISMKVYPVKYADPNAVVTIINQWSRSRSTSGGRARSVAASDVVTATPEHATQSVVVTASKSNHLIVQELIESLDDESLGTGLRKQHVLKLKYANSSELAQQLTQVFRNAGTLRRGDRGPTFVSNPTSNAIVATLNDQELAEVQELLATIDVEPSLDAQRVTEVYPLQYADPGSLNHVVLNMFRWDRRGQASPSEQVTSAVDWGTRSLIVTANAKNHEVLKKMIEKADVESAVTKESFVYQLNVANAEAVARTLQDAYRGRRRTGRGEQPVTITADPSTNSLIILATKAEMEELEALIKPLDVEPDLQRGQQVKTFVLKNADPWVAQDAITKLFRGAGRGASDQVSAVADFSTNSVIVSASTANMKRVEAFMAEIETAEGRQQEVHVINLENAEAESVSRTLNEIFVRSQQRRGGGAPPISISALPGSKAVLVKCNAEDFAEIAQVVTEVDTEEAMGGEVRVITLSYVDATETQRAMEETLRKSGGRGRGELIGDVRISALAQSNAVVISGTKEKVERLEEQIRELDEAGETGSVPHVIPLQHAKVAQVLPVLQEMFAETRGRSRGQTPPVITGNDMLNALIVRASLADLTAIQAVITELDTEEAGEKPNFRIIQVAQGINVIDLAEQIASAINEGQEKQYGQVGRGGRGGRGQVPSIIATPDLRTNSIVFSGSWGLFDEAEELAKKMEGLGPAGGLHTTVVTVKNRSVEEIQALIDKLTQQPSDSRGSSRARRGSSSSRGRSPGSSRSPRRRR